MERSCENPHLKPPLPSRRASADFAHMPTITSASAAHSDNGHTENIFQFPTALHKNASSSKLHCLVDFADRENDFYKTLHKSIAQLCGYKGTQNNSSAAQTPNSSTDASTRTCETCQRPFDETPNLTEPMHSRLNLSIKAAYGAIEQLKSLYSLWDQLLTVEEKFREDQKRFLHAKKAGKEHNAPVKLELTDAEESLALADSILAEVTANAELKRNAFKQQRERSKSVVEDASNKSNNEGRFHMLRRQSTYSDFKSKVSKWTKVKAAFKWERANVPALNDGTCHKEAARGLQPMNSEIAKYLRVPSSQGGAGSSADSILSSSSGHFLSDPGGTPGTISSASSMDDIDCSCHNALRRDSSKSDSRCDSHLTDDGEALHHNALRRENSVGAKSESPSRNLSKSSAANRSVRKISKVLSDFEALPEDDIAEIKTTHKRRTKLPPSPLDLDLKQDLCEVYMPQQLKSPKDATNTCNRIRKFSSPGHSSVPSSPSRHSDYFAFESEDLSSGDFSEPNSPNYLTTQQTFDEINRKYALLRAKLDMEFEEKCKKWDRMKANPNACRALTLINSAKPEEISPKPSPMNAQLLEENLTADFKKKLRKWRVKKQTSVCAAQPPVAPSTSPCKDIIGGAEQKAKIDWQLWKTGQIKLEGQGLSPLPEQKDLPEDFQKKLQEWNKRKRGSTSRGNSANDSFKRSNKHAADVARKTSDEDRFADKEKRADKQKVHEKDKSERLAKLKAIVTDHPAKEIEVKTSAGVMKFEGISRKFTRKLYEWEKARGIGPESSTFALLHPGYCPIDVGRICKQSQNADNSPALSRSLSLDSVAPNILQSTKSQQASSLSLNDVNDFKELEIISTNSAKCAIDLRKFDEPEAVMVEVEDHIEETACPLITAHSLVEKQLPVYKYEEAVCNDFCNTKRVQSFESHTNLAPLLSVLKSTDELLKQIKQASPDLCENIQVRNCEAALSVVRNIYAHFKDNLMKASVLNAISDVQLELSRMRELSARTPLDEACCQEIIEERIEEYNEELGCLKDCLELLKQAIHGGVTHYAKDIVPDINIISEDCIVPENAVEPVNKIYNAQEQSSTAVDSTDEHSASAAGSRTELHASNTIQRGGSNVSAGGNTGGSNSSVNTKRKLRLRKMGSRQNSKTESDSSDAELPNSQETSRRLKRKNYRLKQRSFEEDFMRRTETPIQTAFKTRDDIAYVLKMKPGKPIEQYANGTLGSLHSLRAKSCTGAVDALPFMRFPANYATDANVGVNQNENVFVKTKRKVFTTIPEPTATDGIAVIEQEVDESGNVKTTEHTQPADIVDAVDDPWNCMAIKMKCCSLNDLHNDTPEGSRKCHSLEDMQAFKNKLGKNVRAPLASDSFRVISKTCTNAKRDIFNTQMRSQDNHKLLEHRFRKNTDKMSNTNIRPNGVISKKIDQKLQKKTPVELAAIDGLLESSVDMATPTNSEPHTPLSERALRLQKAKEQFLLGATDENTLLRDNIARTEAWAQHRRSDYSLSSGYDDESNLPKSLSAGTIKSNTDTATCSDAGTDMDMGSYDTLPKAAAVRTQKKSSKLGLSSLASKLRRVKIKKKHEPETNVVAAEHALTELCRQSLLAEAIAAPQIYKSQSAPFKAIAFICGQTAAGEGNITEKSNNAEKLNKSQSEQYVKSSRESAV